MTPKIHQEMLRKYADVVIKVGLNLKPGQALVVYNSATRGIPLHVAPFIREITRSAYQAGAAYVDVIWNDEALLRTRVKLAPQDSFNQYSDWHIQGIMNVIERGGALLTIHSNNPGLLSNLDPERVGALQQTHLERFDPVIKASIDNRMNWCVISAASPDWAVKLFPSLSPRRAENKLWKAIFETARIDRDDPVAAWEEHVQNLNKRANVLNLKKYKFLKYKAPGTDLTVGLPVGHTWISARERSKNGIEFIANLPTEEVFTMPHRDQVEGTVRGTFPLLYGGVLIEGLSFTFEKGRIVKAGAKKGETHLKKMISPDEGASRLGEVALVPVSSPLAKRGHLFYDTLLDENASCHLAVGSAYRSNLAGAQEISDEEFIQRGGNVSITHIDFMLGSSKMDIDGVRDDGSLEPVMRRGEWAFDV